MFNAGGLFVCSVFFFPSTYIMQKPSLVKLSYLVMRVIGFILLLGWVSWIPNLDLLVIDSSNVIQISKYIIHFFIMRI